MLQTAVNFVLSINIPEISFPFVVLASLGIDMSIIISSYTHESRDGMYNIYSTNNNFYEL